uniref:Craniofacial development protein 2 n=1 Tax=Cacopsylla melanoneura TaxID=428564 RepID=A0A8D8Q0R7_9HEMI
MVKDRNTKPRNRTGFGHAPGTNKKDFRLGTWNIRTLYKAGAFDNLLHEARRYNIDLLAIQETRWAGNGDVNKNGYKFIYGGTDKHELGTGFLIKTNFENEIKDVKFITNRISYIILKGKYKSICLLNAHAPTEDKDQDTKAEFYETLDSVMDSFTGHSMKILLGDMNAKLGHEHMYRPALGNYSLHACSNDNGVRLLEFALSKNMLVKSTMFPHRRIHKGTWISPDGRTINQIDHVLVDKRWQSNILDVRTYRDADVDSDHMLVIVKLRERIKSQNQGKSYQRKLDQDKLKDPILQRQFQQKLSEEIENNESNMGEDKTINDINSQLTNIVYNGAKELLGFVKKPKQNKWFDEECKTAIERRREKRLIAIDTRDTTRIEEYREERRKVKKLTRKKKREHLNNKLDQIEKEDRMKQVRSFYQLVNQQRRRMPNKSSTVKDKNGITLTGKEPVLSRWAEYFKELLNVEQDNQVEELATHENEAEEETPTLHETVQAIKRLKNNKTPGTDELTSELLKKGGPMLREEIHKLIVKCWETETIPDQWREVIIIPLHKKNDPTDCNNYRGIALLNTCYKILSLIILSRIEAHTNGKIGEYQAGFRRNRSTTDQIHTLRNILEKRVERNIDTCILFIDFRKSYDCLIRNAIWNAMHELSIPRKLVNLVKQCCMGAVNKVRVGGEMSSAFEVETGLKQGDGISPLLFNITLQKVIQDLWQDETLICKLLAFADDIAMIGNTMEEIEESLKIVEERAKEVGLKINTEKTKYMLISKNTETRLNTTVIINNQTFEQVTDFKYLGVTINENNRIEPEIRNRMNNACRSLYSMNHILISKRISKNAKLKIYDTIIKPVLLYGSETWPIKQNILLKMQAFENRILRKIFGPTIDQDTNMLRRRKNRELEEMYNKPMISNVIQAKVLQWAGHVARADAPSNIKRTLDLQYNQARAIGRPRIKWEDGVENTLRSIGIQEEWRSIAQDRHEWRRLVNQVKDPRGL